MSEVLRQLESDHSNLAHLLDLLARELEVLETGEQQPNYELICAILDYLQSYPDLGHHPKEDVVYRLLHRRAPQAAERIGDLIEDHRELAALTRGFAAAIDRVLADLEISRERLAALGRQFLERYREHIRREDAEFFPAARMHLTTEDWLIADAEFEAPNDPLFGPAVEERFAWLRAQIEDIAEDAR